MTYRFTPTAPGVHTFTAHDGELTATLVRTYAARIRIGNVVESKWAWEVRTFGEVVDSGECQSGGIAVARERAVQCLDHIAPIFEDVN